MTRLLSMALPYVLMALSGAFLARAFHSYEEGDWAGCALEAMLCVGLACFGGIAFTY